MKITKEVIAYFLLIVFIMLLWIPSIFIFIVGKGLPSEILLFAFVLMNTMPFVITYHIVEALIEKDHKKIEEQ